MIYRNSYFKKELRQAYIENKQSTRRNTAFGLFLGLVSFAVYFVFQTLQQSVLADAVPEIMQPSFYSTVYLYIHTAFAAFTVYFMVYYDSLFFSEIRKNSWYLLVQMGYNPVRMIFAKLSARVYEGVLVYSIGFGFTVFLTVFLKFPFVSAYLPALYLAGLTDLMLLSALCMTGSLYVRTLLNARYATLFCAAGLIVLKAALGQYGVLSNRVAMQNLLNLLDPSRTLYLPVAAAVGLLCALVCLLRAGTVARYYTFPYDEALPPPSGELVLIDSATGQTRRISPEKAMLRNRRLFDSLSTTVLILFICAMLAFNLLIILINTSTPGSEVSIRGMIPYIFKSDTMSPEIMLNDLTYFQKVDSQYPIAPGQIVLFEDNHVIYVERVTQISAERLLVDIDNYPSMAQPGAMVKNIPRQAVHGVYAGRSRWLGALILFANTIIGRVVFLLIPAVLLFYQKQISEHFSKQREQPI